MKMHLHVKLDVKTPQVSQPSQATELWTNGELKLSYTYDQSQGRVDWIMQNLTDKVQYVTLLRGATLDINGQTGIIPDYLFGDAFAEVYFANGLSSYITDLNNIPLYSLAFVSIYGHPFSTRVAFVFQLPPKSTITAPEYGFVNLKDITGELVPVTPKNAFNFIVIYDYAEIVEYEQEAGVKVSAPPDPYVVYSYLFKTDNLGYPVTPRTIIPISKEDTNIVSDIVGFLNKLKKLF